MDLALVGPRNPVFGWFLQLFGQQLVKTGVQSLADVTLQGGTTELNAVLGSNPVSSEDEGRMGWGVILLLSCFCALLLGVLLSRRQAVTVSISVSPKLLSLAAEA